MRPISIVNFERCYLGAIVIGLANSLLLIPTMMRTPQMAQASAMYGSGLIYGSIVIGIAISLALWYFAARKASVVAKWIIVVFFALGLFGVLRNVTTGGLGAVGVLGIVTFVLQAVSVYLLFRPDSNAWFRGERANLGDTFA